MQFQIRREHFSRINRHEMALKNHSFTNVHCHYCELFQSREHYGKWDKIHLKTSNIKLSLQTERLPLISLKLDRSKKNTESMNCQITRKKTYTIYINALRNVIIVTDDVFV